MAPAYIRLLLPLLLLGGAFICGFYVEWAALTAGLVLIWAAPIWLTRIGHPISGDYYDALALAWLCWLVLSLTWSIASDYSQVIVYSLALLPAAFLTWRRWTHAEQAWPWLRGFLWLLALALSLWGILGDPAANFVSKPDGPYIDPNVYAANLNLLWLPLSAYFLIAPPSRPRWLDAGMLLVLGLTALAFFMSASRGAGLAALILFPLVFWQARKRLGFAERTFKWGVVTSLGYAINYWGMEYDLGVRLAETVRSGDSARLLLWQSTWDMIQQHPWLGTGLGSFRLLYPQFRNPLESGSGGYWSHNDYLQIWQEGGLISLLLILTIAFLLARLTWHELRKDDAASGERLGLMAGCLAIFIHAGVNFLLYFPIINLLIGLYWARAMELPGFQTAHKSWLLPVRPAVLRLTAWTVILASGYLLTTSALIQSSVFFTQTGNTLLTRLLPDVPHVAIAHGLSILRPNLSQPHLTMARLFDARLASDGTGNRELDAKLFKEADTQFEEARKALPCLLPLGVFHMDFLLRQGHFSADEDIAGKTIRIARENLACNPRHGLSHAYLALAQHASGDVMGARQSLREAYGQVIYMIEQSLLIAAWLEIKDVEPNPEAVALTRNILNSLQQAEFDPATRHNLLYWDSLILDVDRLARKMNKAASNQASRTTYSSP